MKRTPIFIIAAIIFILAVVYFSTKGPASDQRSASDVLKRPEPTTAQREAAIKAVEDKAVSAVETKNVIDISGCKPVPESLEFKMGAAITFKNSDEKEHVIKFTPKIVFSVPARGDKAVTFDFWEFPGVRNYLCDGQTAGSVKITR